MAHTRLKRPNTFKVGGKTYNLDPQVYYNSQGYCLVTLRNVEEKTIQTKAGDPFTISKVKFQFRGYDSMGSLNDQMTFYEDFASENLLTKGKPTLKSYIYDALGVKNMPCLDLADINIESNLQHEDSFFEPLGDLEHEEVIESFEEKYKLSKVLTDNYGQSFIAVLTRDNTKLGKYSNAGYLSIVPESVLPLSTLKKK